MSKCIVYHRLRLGDRVYVFLFGRFCLHLRHWLQKWQWHEGVDSVDSVDGKCFGWPCWTTVDRVCGPASKTFRTSNVSVDRVEQQLTEFAALLRKLFGQAMLRPCFGHAWKHLETRLQRRGNYASETLHSKPTLNKPQSNPKHKKKHIPY